MKLDNFHRSSASFRVRLALNLKGIAYEYVSVKLMRGESHAPSYEKLNPQGIVPTLADNGTIVQQSMAICEYLEETQPTPEPCSGVALKTVASWRWGATATGRRSPTRS